MCYHACNYNAMIMTTEYITDLLVIWKIISASVYV